MFDVPKYCLNTFLEVANQENDAVVQESLVNWSAYIDGINTAQFVINGSKMFPVHEQHYRNLLHDHQTTEALASYRDELLVELFTMGLSVQANCADRVLIKLVNDKFVISVESIGRYSSWCWIDQRRNTSFSITEPFAALVELVKIAKEQATY